MNITEITLMKILTKEVEFSQQIFSLTNQRVIFWQKEKTLILSDLHVGKAAHFRKSGIAISSGVLLDDLKKLEDLILYFKVEKILIVGDLFHAGYNTDLNLFKEWRSKFTQEFVLITGNHDRLSCKMYDDLGIKCISDFLETSGIRFVHDPKDIKEEGFYVSGHIHPGFILKTKNERLRLPCFAVSERQIVLPAFSKFTGLDTKTLKGNFRNILFTEGTIFEV